MKTIFIKSIKLTNFKGIQSIEIPFDKTITQIIGDNATGKTTIVDAFNWCLFGKDSQDRKDFAIRPRNLDGSQDNRVESEVQVELVVENTPYVLRRVFAGNFVKKHGSNVEEFKGNETKYFIDDVPHKQKEYEQRISSFIDEELFKLLSISGKFFLLDWKKQREILNKLAQVGTDQEIIQSIGGDKYSKLVDVLNSNKTLEMYRKQLSAKRLEIKKSIEDIGPRIAELKNISAPTPPIVDISKEEIQKFIAQENEIIQSVNKQINASQSEINNKIISFNKQISDLQTKRLQLIQDAKNKGNADFNEWKQKIQQLETRVVIEEETINLHNGNNEKRKISIEQLELKRQNLIEDWHKTKCSTYLIKKFESGVCPCCNRENEYSKEAEFQFNEIEKKNAEEFEISKIQTLKRIESEGEELKSEILKIRNAYEVAQKNIETDQQGLEKLKIDLDCFKAVNLAPYILTDERSVEGVVEIDDDIQAIKSLIEETESQRGQEPDIEGNKQNIQELNAKLEEWFKYESSLENYKKTQVRIAELLQQEQNLCNEMASIEQDEFLIDNFNSEKIELVSSRVNSMFQIVKFKMFNQQINGGIEETCEAMVDGVTISNVNNAGRINAGLDIINVLSEFYSVSAPCFIDNAESVTKTIEFKNQLIKLIVSQEYNKLNF